MKKLNQFLILIVIAFSISSLSFSQINSGLVAYYPFNGNANDESGNGLNGIISGASLSADRFGNLNKAYQFDGVDDFIYVNNFPLINNTFSYSCWIKINGNNWNNYLQSFGILGPEPNHIWNFSFNNINRNWDLWDRSNNSWYTGNGGSGNTLEWTHVVIIYSGGVEYLYVNNNLLSSRSVSIPISNGGGNQFLIGKINNVPDQCLNGLVDEVRIYNRALSLSEIDELFNEHHKILKLSVIPQGYYNSLANRLYRKDIFKIQIRESVSPYSFVDSLGATLDSLSLNGFYNFTNLQDGSYYIVPDFKNCIETWSISPVNFTSDTTVYNFTTSLSQAFGNNQKQVDTSPIRFGNYSGDVNKDGIIDVGDIIPIYNDAIILAEGDVITDLTGDRFVDNSDLLMAYNNTLTLIIVRSP